MRRDDQGPAFPSAIVDDDRLARLAALLDCPTEAFTDGVHAPHDVRQSRELMALWTAIEGQDDRERVLQFMRTLSEA